MLIQQVLLTLALFWHVLAFAGGGVNVVSSYRGLFTGRRDPSWSRIIRSAEWQLWVSGLAVIGLGGLTAGWHVYLSNPKLWAKLTVVTVWLGSTIVMRRIAVPRMRLGDRSAMLWTCSVSGACWIYGAMLGVGKPLSGGVLPVTALLAGFALVVVACLAATAGFERRRGLRAVGAGASASPAEQTADARP